MDNQELLNAVRNLEEGLSSADLGGHLFKVRVRRKHGGKSSGFRTILVYRKNDMAVFLYGSGKNEKGNIDRTELRYFKKLGSDLLTLSPEQIGHLTEQKVLFDPEEAE